MFGLRRFMMSLAGTLTASLAWVGITWFLRERVKPTQEFSQSALDTFGPPYLASLLEEVERVDTALLAERPFVTWVPIAGYIRRRYLLKTARRILVRAFEERLVDSHPSNHMLSPGELKSLFNSQESLRVTERSPADAELVFPIRAQLPTREVRLGFHQCWHDLTFLRRAPLSHPWPIQDWVGPRASSYGTWSSWFRSVSEASKQPKDSPFVIQKKASTRLKVGDDFRVPDDDLVEDPAIAHIKRTMALNQGVNIAYVNAKALQFGQTAPDTATASERQSYDDRQYSTYTADAYFSAPDSETASIKDVPGSMLGEMAANTPVVVRKPDYIPFLGKSK
jgi:hypothetical protein